jgi:hypothetical protein
VQVVVVAVPMSVVHLLLEMVELVVVVMVAAHLLL